jgi:hypothetical protein
MPLTQTSRQKLAFLIVDRLLQAAGKLTFYHGSDYKNLKHIAKQGLVANSGAVWSGNAAIALQHGQKAVYLTPDFQLAARYGRGSNKSYKPTVLEVLITTPKRFRKLRYDPLDRHSTSWSMEDSYVEEEESVVHALEQGANQIASQLGFDIHPYLKMTDLESLSGLNVFKWILSSLSQLPLTKLQRQQALRMAQKRFSGEVWDYMEVRRDGTLKLTEEYFYSREQLMYMKGLPSSSVKGVWVRAKDFEVPASKILETRSGGYKELPGESADRVEDLVSLIGSLRWEVPEDLEPYIEKTRALDYPELLAYLVEVSHRNVEDISVKEWEEELESFEMGVHEDWGEERISDVGTWVKVSLQSSLSLSVK